jgi:type IV pilus assembly protein PilY1
MKHIYRLCNFARSTALLIGFAGLLAGPAGAVPPFTDTAIEAVPPNISAQGGKPMMMITASKDHTLFGPMFTDFEDLDGDGTIDVTFLPTFFYYGYFDYSKCYSYDTDNNRFVPAANATLTSGRYTCSSSNSHWSGNFLNWATTSRLDAVRKMLYGGKRSTDSTSLTVLERLNLSKDSHSFVKYYKETDIRDYTPFTTTSLTKTNGDNKDVYAGLTICNRSDTMGEAGNPVIRLVKGNYRMWGTVEGTVCEWDAGTMGNKLRRYYKDNDKGKGGINHEDTPPNASTDGAKYGSIGPELTARVEVCKSTLLGLERCKAYVNGSTTIYKPIGLLQDFGTPQGSASAARAEFGLITGSYDQNLKAGALRKNTTDFLDEIKPTTGQFCFSSGASCPTTTLTDGRSYLSNGAIKAIDNLLLYGRGSSNYSGSNVQLPSEMTNGTLPAWGNPIGEMVVQALNYFAGLTSTNPSSTSNDTGKGIPVATWSDPLTDNTTGSKRTELYGKPICRSMNILALSSSALSFDHDDADAAFVTLPNRSRGNLTSFTDAVGAAEGIHGTARSVGSVSGGFGEECSSKTVTNLSSVTGVCPEAPGIGGSYKVAGAALYANTNRVRSPSTVPADLPKWGLKVKTYAASLSGGVARIEVKIPGTGTSATNPAKYVYITPESLWAANSNAKRMPGAMLTFASISSSATHGAFMVTWNDSLFGGDYDMDIAGFLRYDIIGSSAPYRLKITTDIVNVGAGWTGSHGFSVIGTKDFDGRYLTHRHLTSDSVISGAKGYLCGNSTYRNADNLATVTLTPAIPPATGVGKEVCDTSTGWNVVRDRDSPVTLTFEMKGVDNVILRDPLWYAAKYGSFEAKNSADSTALPDATDNKWDTKRADGNQQCGRTGLPSCSDGEPDGYFLARRPELLENQLRDMLESIISSNNAAPATSAPEIYDEEKSFKYVAQFDSNQNSGTVSSCKFNVAKCDPASAEWNAGAKLSSIPSAERHVITNDGSAGIAFNSSTTYSTAFDNALRGTGTGALTSAVGLDLINYVRGSRDKEKPSGIWDTRPTTNIMGGIINSTPWLQLAPSARYTGVTPNYNTFKLANQNRTKMLWVGSNDGLLHGLKASTLDSTTPNGLTLDSGLPILSYLPSPVLSRLRTMATDLNTVIAAMDGSPFTGDVLIAGSTSQVWKTYLFSSLGRGGKGFFALDVTNPSLLTETNASSIFKWMFTSADDADLGYLVGDQVINPISNQAAPIVRLNLKDSNGKNRFGVLLPNGMNSSAGKAFLYVLLIDGPDSSGNWGTGAASSTARYIKLATDAATSNGMMGASWTTAKNSDIADVVYSTDLLGRVWRFDLSSEDPTQWKSSYVSSGTPLPMFEAKDGTTRLPIVSAPTISLPDMGGAMVSFGTGRALLTGDFPNTSLQQRFYSIWDRGDTSRAVPPSDRSTLVNRALASTTDGYYLPDKSAIDWTTKDGWYINLPLTSQMLLSPAKLVDRNLVFNGISRQTDSSLCFPTPEAKPFNVNPETGIPTSGALGFVVVVENGVTKTENLAMANQFSSSGCTGSACKADQKLVYVRDYTAAGRTACGAGKVAMRAVGANSNAIMCFSGGDSRIQWREVPGMRTR